MQETVQRNQLGESQSLLKSALKMVEKASGFEGAPSSSVV